MKGRRWHASTCNSNLCIDAEQTSNFRGLESSLNRVLLEYKLFKPLKLQDAALIDGQIIQHQKARHRKLATVNNRRDAIAKAERQRYPQAWHRHNDLELLPTLTTMFHTSLL